MRHRLAGARVDGAPGLSNPILRPGVALPGAGAGRPHSLAHSAARLPSPGLRGVSEGSSMSFMGEGRQDPAGPSSTRRVNLQEAAAELRTTVDALKKRDQRGTIPPRRTLKDACGSFRTPTAT